MDSVVKTRSGPVQGLEVQTASGPISAYLGIPFAASTAGAQRFRAPRREEPWHEVRNATTFGFAAPQVPDAMLAAHGIPTPPPPPFSESEALNLAVWTPDADGAARPVMVWVHGGAYMTGSNRGPSAHGAELAAAGDVVVVSLNYRLGALGFLYLDHLLGAEYQDSSGRGLLDIIAGLEWVRDSIRAFGGDPENVTLMGQSAGGAAVATLLGSPLATGLFSRAIVESGTAERWRSPLDAEAMTAIFLEEAQLDATRASELIELPLDELLRVQERFVRRVSAGMVGMPVPFQPTLGGGLIPVAPLEAIASGLNADVDLIVGTNLDEAALFAVSPPPTETRTPRELVSIVLAEEFADGVSYQDYAAAAAAAAGTASGRPLTESQVLGAVLADRMYRQPTMRLVDARLGRESEDAATYVYLFTWPSPMMGGRMGATHAVEVPFVFRQLANPAARGFVGDTPPLDLSEWMSSAWARFARTGLPTEDSTEWPRHERTVRATAILDADRRVESDPRGDLREFWVGHRSSRSSRYTAVI